MPGEKTIIINPKERLLRASIAVVWLLGVFVLVPFGARADSVSVSTNALTAGVLAAIPVLWIAWSIGSREIVKIGVSNIQVVRKIGSIQIGESRNAVREDVLDVFLDESSFSGKNRRYTHNYIIIQTKAGALKLKTDVSANEGHEFVSALRKGLGLNF